MPEPVVRISSVLPVPVEIPLRRLFTTARRQSTTARNVRVRVRLSDGVEGWGEASPAQYVTGETPESVVDAIEEAARALIMQDVGREAVWLQTLRDAVAGAPTACSAVEMALTEALARRGGVPLWRRFGGARRCVVSDLTIPICPPEEAAEEARRAAEFGYSHLKIKVGGATVDEDEARVRAITDAAPECKIRLDANQAFTPEAALAFVARLQSSGARLELLEQPVHCDDWDGLAYVTARSPLPVIADEAVRSPADALHIARTNAAHGVNIKLAKSGVRGSLEIITICRAAGLRLMLGCMMESDLGIAAAVHLACGTGAFRYLDLDSHQLIGLPPPYIGFRQRGGVLSVVGSTPGLGPI